MVFSVSRPLSLFGLDYSGALQGGISPGVASAGMNTSPPSPQSTRVAGAFLLQLLGPLAYRGL